VRKLVPAMIVLLLAVGAAVARPEAERAFERWRRAVARRGLDPSAIDYPLAVTPQMERIAGEVAFGGSERLKLNRLQSWLFNKESFAFDYDSRGTYTAAEALERREGNCVSFTSLFIALGRAAGVEVRAALLASPRAAEREDDLIVVNTHIVAIHERPGGLGIFDFNRQRRQGPFGLAPVDDVQFTAIHLNNHGTDALRAGEYERARELLEAAVRLWPDFAGAWANLGVARRRQGNVAAAYDAYRRALEIAPGNATILNNLAALYESQGHEAEAREALLAARLREASPHTLIVRGDLELADGHVGRAMRLYRRALRQWRDHPEPRLALARGELARGRTAAARRQLLRALALDPDNPEARRLQRRLEDPPPLSSP